MNKNIHTAVLAGVTALLCSRPGWSVTTGADVLNELHQADRMEIHMGMLAQAEGSTNEVRDYGKMLESDHKANDVKVRELAAKEGVTLKSAKPGMMDKMEMKELKAKSGADFDKAFAKKMIEGHNKNIAKLEDAQKSDALSQDDRNLIADTLPALHKHLEMAQKIYGQPS